MSHNVYIYILICAAVSFAVRVLPIALIRNKIKNKFFQSFLYYVPYVTLAVMTFPAILMVTNQPIAGAASLIIGIILSWIGADIYIVSGVCCVTVFVLTAIL